MNPTHRIALEPRSGIWLLFYETLHHVKLYRENGYYKQRLLRQVGANKLYAKQVAESVKNRMGLFTDVIVRDDSHRDERLRV